MKAVVYVFLPAALLIAALFFTWQGFQAPAPETVAQATELPRYEVTGAQWLRLDRSGEPEFHARAKSIEYFADESAVLHEISLDSLGGHDSPWHVEAPDGAAPAHERRLLLKGGVEAVGDRVSGEPVRFTTATLWVDLLRQELRTEAPVALQTDQRSATARGLRADFKGERVQLLNDVQVDYVPEG